MEYPGRTLPIVSINYKAPAWNADDPLAVATEVLGSVAFGPNSETYQKLVIEQQRVQFLFDDFQLARDPALVGVTTMVSDPADTDAVKQELLDAVERYRNEPVDAELLARTKSYLKYSFLMGLETARDVAMALLRTVINTGAIEPVESYFQAVHSSDLTRAAEADDLRTLWRTVETGVERQARSGRWLPCLGPVRLKNIRRIIDETVPAMRRRMHQPEVTSAAAPAATEP